MDMTLERELRELGFTDNEIKVYLTLFRIGRAKAGRISKECSLERTSTYNALKRLQEKGVVSSIIEGKTRLFAAGTPHKLVDMIHEKEEVIKIIIPQLESLKKFEREKENILKFRGYAGVKTVLNDILKTCGDKEEYLIMGSEGQLSERMPTFSRIFVAKKDRKKLRARILIRETRASKPHSKHTTFRYVPQDVISPSNVTIYKGKVAMILWSEVPEGIIIDDEDVAKTFRSYFEFMWKHAKKK